MHIRAFGYILRKTPPKSGMFQPVVHHRDKGVILHQIESGEKKERGWIRFFGTFRRLKKL